MRRAGGRPDGHAAVRAVQLAAAAEKETEARLRAEAEAGEPVESDGGTGVGAASGTAAGAKSAGAPDTAALTLQPVDSDGGSDATALEAAEQAAAAEDGTGKAGDGVTPPLVGSPSVDREAGNIAEGTEAADDKGDDDAEWDDWE